MKSTYMSEKGLETIIVKSLRDEAGYRVGQSSDYDMVLALDLPKLWEFLFDTQRPVVDLLY
ncbi:MAG: hypothetical protein EOO61_20660, partial [Hymenobacter sp.]